MNKSSWVGLRLVVVLAVVIATPLLAVPRVHRGLTALWTGAGIAVPRGTAQSSQRAPDPSPSSPARVTVRLSAPRVDSHPLRRPAAADAYPLQNPVERSAAVNARCRQIERELKALGAGNLRLRETADPVSRYRFYCEIPVAGTTAYRRPCHAEGPTVEAVMEDVLTRVRTRLAQFPTSVPRSDTDRR